jgi:hypothetical protein
MILIFRSCMHGAWLVQDIDVSSISILCVWGRTYDRCARVCMFPCVCVMPIMYVLVLCVFICIRVYVDL